MHSLPFALGTPSRNSIPPAKQLLPGSLPARMAVALAVAVLTAALVAPPRSLALPGGKAGSDGRWLMSGTWESGRDKDRDQLWVSFRNEGPGGSRNQHWTRIEAGEIDGLDLRSMTSARVPVEFRVKRDAGTIRASGEFVAFKGEGTFTLELDPAFAAELSRRGVGRPTEAEHAQLLLAGAGYGLLDALAREKYAMPRAALLVRMVHHGVNESYITGMARAGYRLESLEALIKARDHGVDPSFIQGMAQAGYRGVPFEQLLRARDHGADPDFAADLAEAGYRNLPLDLLIRARDHGVDAGYVESLHRAGFAKLPLEAVIRARDHGVTGGFAKRVRTSRPAASLDEVISMRDRGERP